MIHLYVTGFGRPDLLREQRRLLKKNLREPFEVCVIDNTPTDIGAKGMEATCRRLKVGYMRCPSESHEHIDALNLAARTAHADGNEFWMTVDHDVFPITKTTLTDLIAVTGFYGIGQRHPATSFEYLWPGFAGFSRDWLAGRIPDFSGIRGRLKRDDGDTGSMLHSLFGEEEWARMPRLETGYEAIREPDDIGLQSWGYERLTPAWIHFTNASRWLEVPGADERDRLLLDLVKSK